MRNFRVFVVCVLCPLCLSGVANAQDAEKRKKVEIEFWGGIHAEVATVTGETFTMVAPTMVPNAVPTAQADTTAHFAWTPLVGLELSHKCFTLHTGLAWNLLPQGGGEKIPFIVPTPIIEVSVEPARRTFLRLSMETHLHDGKFQLDSSLVSGVAFKRASLGIGGSLWATETIYGAGPTVYLHVEVASWLSWELELAGGPGLTGDESKPVPFSMHAETGLEVHFGRHHHGHHDNDHDDEGHDDGH